MPCAGSDWRSSFSKGFCAFEDLGCVCVCVSLCVCVDHLYLRCEVMAEHSLILLKAVH